MKATRRTAAFVTMCVAIGSMTVGSAIADEDQTSELCRELDGRTFPDTGGSGIFGFAAAPGDEVSVRITEPSSDATHAILLLDGRAVDRSDEFPATLSVVIAASDLDDRGRPGVLRASVEPNSASATFTWSCTPGSSDGDEDGDGVPDRDDLCPGTVADGEPVRKNRFRMNEHFEFVDSAGTVVADIQDTRGCSAAQIIAASGLGRGHERFGLSRGELAAWIDAHR